MWLKALLNWLTSKNDKKQLEEPKEVLPEETILKKPPLPIRKGTLEDIRAFTNVARNTMLLLS